MELEADYYSAVAQAHTRGHGVSQQYDQEMVSQGSQRPSPPAAAQHHQDSRQCEGTILDPNPPASTRVKKGAGCECGASAQPSFGFAEHGLRGARWCSKCPQKPAAAVNVRAKRCECGKSVATIGPVGLGHAAARWCSQCPSKPQAGVISASFKRCECGKGRASYHPPGGTWKTCRWCKSCCPPDAVLYRNNTQRCECGKRRPSFGLVADQLKRWCKKCPSRPSEATCLANSQRCECGRVRPAFGLPGERRTQARWCLKCPTRPAASINLCYTPVKGHQLPPRMRPEKPPRVRKKTVKAKQPKKQQQEEAEEEERLNTDAVGAEEPVGASSSHPQNEVIAHQSECGETQTGQPARRALRSGAKSQTASTPQPSPHPATRKRGRPRKNPESENPPRKRRPRASAVQKLAKQPRKSRRTHLEANGPAAPATGSSQLASQTGNEHVPSDPGFVPPSGEDQQLLAKQKALEDKRAMLLKLQQELAAEEAELEQYQKGET